MTPTSQKVETFKQAVIESSNNPSFIHHPWFVTYHLEIVDRLASELMKFYPAANPEMVKVLVWLHDYGKTISFENQYELTLTEGKAKLLQLGFDPQFVDTVINYMSIMDKKLEIDIKQAPIEVQIVSSADGCSHFVGPFMSIWWQENADKSVEDLMLGTIKKAEKDWNRKIVLPEARKAFESHYKLVLQQSGVLPERFIK